MDGTMWAEELVSVDELVVHLKQPPSFAQSDQADDLQAKLDAAHVMANWYVKQRRIDLEGAWAAEVDGWSADSVPADVRLGVLVLAADLFQNRGDEDPTNAPKVPDWRYPVLFRRILDHYRDPTLA